MGRAFVDFQKSFKSRTEMQVLVPGVAGDMERVILITTYYLIHGYSSKVMRQNSITWVPPNCFWGDIDSSWLPKPKTDSIGGMKWEILGGVYLGGGDSTCG